MNQTPKSCAKTDNAQSANAQTAKFLAQPYIERSTKSKVIDAIMMELALLDAPFVTPRHIAPRLGLSAAGLRYYCRNCRCLKSWTGSYRFFLDDEGHIAALRALVSLAVHSVQALPKEFQPKVH